MAGGSSGDCAWLVLCGVVARGQQRFEVMAGDGLDVIGVLTQGVQQPPRALVLGGGVLRVAGGRGNGIPEMSRPAWPKSVGLDWRRWGNALCRSRVLRRLLFGELVQVGV